MRRGSTGPPEAKEVLLKINSSGTATTGALLIACLAALILPIRAYAASAGSPRSLTAEQVACNTDQLRSLSKRSALLFGPFHRDRTATLLWTYGPPGGFQGLAFIEPYDEDGRSVAGEHQLAFSVSPNPVKLLRNPARPQLDSIVMTRDELNSDLSHFEESHAAALVLDPTIDPLKNDDPASLAIIDNLTADDGGNASDSKPGRGLADLLVPCHDAFTRTDLHVFGVLSRVVRAQAYTGRRGDPKAGRFSKLAAVYRGSAATPDGDVVRTSYRVDLFPTGEEDLGRVSVELLIDIAADGSLGDATLRLLPNCTAQGQRDCTSVKTDTVVGVVKPGFGDQRWDLATAPSVCWGEGCATETTFSFQDVLEGTTWGRPN